MAKRYQRGKQNPYITIRILLTPLVSFGHCVFCSSVIYGFCLPLWYLLAIVLSVLLWYTDSAYPFGIFWPLCCLFFCYHIRTENTMAKIYQRGKQNPYITEEQKTQWPKDTSFLLWYTDSAYPFGIFWPLCFLFFCDIRILLTPLVSFGHCVFCSSVIYGFCLPLSRSLQNELE
jgi:hypothetical protein